MNNKTRILLTVLIVVALACAGYLTLCSTAGDSAYAADKAPGAAPPAANQPGQPAAAPAVPKPAEPAYVPKEPSEPQGVSRWLLIGIVIALLVIVAGYFKSKGEEGLDRTKFLSFVLAAVAIVVAGYYGGKFMTKAPPKQPKISIKMGEPSSIKPVAPQAAATQTSAVSPGQYTPVIKVMEKGKEVVYGGPEDFLARTSLKPSETGAFADRRLAEARKADAAARARGDKAAMERTSKDLGMAERLVALVRASMVASPGTKLVPYVSLGKRDPFMSPLEVPKVYPEVPPNAPPLERVPTESIAVKAIVWNAKGFRALVVSPDGRGYTVRLGDRIGNKGGRIVKISEKRVYVTEKIMDVLGDIEIRDIVLKLYKEAE